MINTGILNPQILSLCQELADWSACIVDTRNAMAGVKVKPRQVWKA
jgi:hypothetical protein